jgi:hypothetical protein
MKNFYNERGYVLISVLAIIILIFAFSMMIMPKTFNTALQVNKTKGSSQAKDMSEMGIHYAHAYLQSEVTKAIADAKADPRFINNSINHDTLICEKLKNRFKTFSIFNKELIMNNNTDYNPNHSFQVRNFEEVSFEPSTITLTNSTCTDFKNMKIPIESTGKILNKSEKSLKAYFLIENKDNMPISSGVGINEVRDPETIMNSFFKETQTIELKGNTISNKYSTVRFTNTVGLRGNGVLMVGGNAWFQGTPSVDYRGSNNEILISGNAYFSSEISFGGNMTNYICIKKGAYLWKDNKWIDYPTTPVDIRKFCPYKPEDVKYYYDINEWGIVESNLNVIY